MIGPVGRWDGRRESLATARVGRSRVRAIADTTLRRCMAGSAVAAIRSGVPVE